MAIYFTFRKEFSPEDYSDLGSLLLPFAFTRQSRSDGILAYTRRPEYSPQGISHSNPDQMNSPRSHIVVLSPRKLRVSFDITDEVDREVLPPLCYGDIFRSQAQSILDLIRDQFSPTSYFSDLPSERSGVTRFCMGETPLHKNPYKISRKLRDIIALYQLRF